MAKKKSEKLDTSRRFFMKKATAVVGGVATTAVAATGVSKAIDKAVDHSEEYKADDRHQGEIMAKKKFVEMSSAETDQMLDVIIKHHQKMVS